MVFGLVLMLLKFGDESVMKMMLFWVKRLGDVMGNLSDDCVSQNDVNDVGVEWQGCVLKMVKCWSCVWSNFGKMMSIILVRIGVDFNYEKWS